MITIKNIFAKFAVASLCAATVMGCSDDFLINNPQGSLSDANMENPANIELLINAAYAGLYGRTNEQGDPWCRPMTNWSSGDVRGDNAYKGGGGTGDQWETHSYETFQVQPDNGMCDGRWFNLYSVISRCQSALRVLNKMDEASYPALKSRKAEMKVLRSHFYFMLQRDFNMIPYMDENVSAAAYVDVLNNEWTREQHLDRIYNELKNAAADLPETQAERGRINKKVALAYAAKVRLYQAYQQDETTHAVININKEYLQDVITLIDQVQGDLLADFQQLDLVAYEGSAEAVFAVMHSMNDGSEDHGRINWSNLLNSPGGDTSPYHGDGFFVPSQDLINAYQTDANGLPVFDYQSLPDYATVSSYNFDESTKTETFTVNNTEPNVDPRLDFVVGRPGITYKTYKDAPCGAWVRDKGTYGYNCAKRFWESPESPETLNGWPWGASQLDWNIIRYADLKLWKAEALIEIGTDLETARILINDIRKRAKNSAYVKDFNDPTKDAANYNIGLYPAAGWTQDYARKALRTETRLEKALEGERFYDLVRWGIAKETMTNYFAAEKGTRIYYENASFDAGEEYFPIPVAQYNFSLGKYVQNPGYPSFK